MADSIKLIELIATGKLEDAKNLVNETLVDGIAPQEIIDNYLVKGMETVGERFELGKAFVPNLLMAARAMKGCIDILKPLMKGTDQKTLGTIVIGTVKGDLHDIGKNLVASMLEGCGFKVVNLGVDVSGEQFAQAIRDNNAQIVCLSALLTTTMSYMSDVVKIIESEGLRDKVKILIGGAPVNQKFADEIGADGYSSNANEAVILAKHVLNIC